MVLGQPKPLPLVFSDAPDRLLSSVSPLPHCSGVSSTEPAGEHKDGGSKHLAIKVQLLVIHFEVLIWHNFKDFYF